MRKVFFLLTALTFLTISNAQSQTLKVAAGGDKAVLFNFVGLSNVALNAYNGGIGGKYFIMDGLALRAMLLFSINNNTTKSNPESTDKTLGFGVGGAVEYHLPLSSSVSPYLGGGLFFTTVTNKQNQFTEFKTTQTTFGIGALAGVEYYFNQNLSLAAEYQFGLSTSSTTRTGLSDQNNLQIGFQTAGLTLAVYF